MKHDFIENKIIILSKETMDSLLVQKDPADLIGLYCFYYYTAKWQGTNQPKATIGYAAKGLKWGTAKTRDNKKILVNLGLIEDIRHIDEKTKRVKGWYIKVKYLWKEESHPITLPQCGLSHSVEKTDPNALSVSSINALNGNNEILVAQGAIGNKINLLMDLFKEVNPSYARLFPNKNQRAALERIIKIHGIDKTEKIIKLLPASNRAQYAPTITTPIDLENKLGALAAYWQKQKGRGSMLIRI